MTVTAIKPAKSTRKAKGDGHLRRAEILIAAERIFVREGYQRATIRKIAEEVGVSSTALYMHFRDKDEILLEIAEASITTLLMINAEIASQGLDPVVQVRRMLEAYMRYGFDNPNAYWLVYCSGEDAGAGSGPRQAQVTELSARCYEGFRAAVAQIEAQGLLRPGGASTAANVLWSACHGLVSLRICRPGVAWESEEELMTGMLDSLFSGLLIR